MLSGEQKQQVLLGRALCRRPKILLLDEVTRHLDVASKGLIDQAIASLYITRIMSPHRPQVIAVLRITREGKHDISHEHETTLRGYGAHALRRWLVERTQLGA